ncbi:VOC family protein [Piscinibacter sp. XHJ-5]|uniref:VOC family protein n=1 Tax=Piscinibacter sp. XHJ-5 TaxID=3037797 RepID=UPI002452CC69|nr:VOC family protein [Piscinibacter sp. XHJ-5]
MTVALDHLVVAARTLDEGVRWCEQTLGISPTSGGKHSLMGTHNRVFSISSARFPRAYLEIIAIDPEATAPARPRWFDLDSVELQAALAHGPQLVHWVARCEDLDARLAALRNVGIDRGEPVAAERDTPHGLLRWRISLRADGQRLARGALPTLIQWGDRHPADTLPASDVALESLQVAGVPEAAWPLCAAAGVEAAAGGAPLAAVLSTPRGRIALHSSH